MNVDTLGTLKGKGTVKGAVTITGTVAPGNSIGQITVVTGPATFNSGSTYDWEFDGSSADLIAITGDLVFDSAGNITINALPLNGGGFEASGTYDLFTFTGSFTDGTDAITTATIGNYVDFVQSGSKWTDLGTLTVTGNAVQLVGFSYIPEPSTIILAGLGLMGVTFRRRR